MADPLPPDVAFHLEALQSSEARHVHAAAQALSSKRGLAPPLLARLRTETRPANREGLLYALIWQGDPRAWWPCVRWLADESLPSKERTWAAEGLAYGFSQKKKGSLSWTVALAVLTEALKDPAPEVRYSALFAIGATRDPSLMPLITPLLGDEGTSKWVVGTVGDEARSMIDDLEWAQRNGSPDEP